MSTETKERQRLMTGADYKPVSEPRGQSFKILDIRVEASFTV